MRAILPYFLEQAPFRGREEEAAASDQSGSDHNASGARRSVEREGRATWLLRLVNGHKDLLRDPMTRTYEIGSSFGNMVG